MIECAKHLQQRGFSRTALADDRDKLALLDAEIDATQRLDLSVVVFLLEPAGFKHPASIRDRHQVAFCLTSSWRVGRAIPSHWAPTRGSARLMNRSCNAAPKVRKGGRSCSTFGSSSAACSGNSGCGSPARQWWTPWYGSW